ncbi:flagellar hook assembly protein FlgD [Xenorhabdus khoisanae]|uniref:flagellar hook assembly protein FlgD n=1 Tax=Xenorhabdus khoisanae TaxID=880157 RepID=UPI0032B6F9FE
MGITSSINESLDNSTVGELASKTQIKQQSSGDIKDNFLKILVAQLENQDPTEPMKNSELTSQIAQISTVHGIEELNKTLGTVVGQMGNNQAMQTTMLINRGVMVPGDKILVGYSEKDISTSRIGFELTRPADNVKITIKDKNGAVVRELDFGNCNAGVHNYKWDGKDADGKEVEIGAYSFTVSASYQDQALVTHPLNYAVVNGVMRGEDGTKLDLGLAGTVTMDQVRQIL